MSGMPMSVRNALYALALTTVASAFYFGWYMHREVEGAFPIWPSWIFFAVISAIFGLFLVFSWKRRNWARWVVVAWSILGVLSVVSGWVSSTLAPIDWVFQLVVTGVEVWACYQLLSPPASIWFRQAHAG